MSKLKQSASSKAQFAAYSQNAKHEKNMLAKLERLCKQQPNNKPLQSKLAKYLDKGVPYTRNRKSNGHPCKGLNNSLGFEKNQMSENMKRSKLPIYYFYGCDMTPATGGDTRLSMCEQFEALGFEKPKYVRKYKKTTR